MNISQTQLFEWVKDGNYETLNEYFSTQLKFSKEKVEKFFSMVDDQRRSVIHWAAYLGQHLLLNWWCKDYEQMIDLNEKDMHTYTPLALASIKGYSGEYNPNNQEKTIRLLVNHGAMIPQTNLDQPNPLHWAYYYGNKELIDFLITNNFHLQLEVDKEGNYPIDYLFLENRPRKYQLYFKEIFQTTVIHYCYKTSGHQFKDLDQINKKKTTKKIRHGTLATTQLPNMLTMQKESNDQSPESEPSKNVPYSNISNMHKSQTSNSFVSKMTIAKSSSKTPLSQQNVLFKFQQKNQPQRIQSKNLDDNNEIPLYDDSNIEMKEPEEERIPDIKFISNNNINLNGNICINLNGSKLLTEQNHNDEQFQSNNLEPPLLIERSPSKDQRKHHRSKKIDENENEKEKENKIDKYIINSLKANLSNNQIYECRLQYWASRLGYTEFFIYFLSKQCNPFIHAYQGYNCLHIAAYKGKHKILRIILESEYQYVEYLEQYKNDPTNLDKSLIFDKKECINILTDQFPSNALHLAIEQENYHCMKILILHGVSVNAVNSRCLKPFELTYNQRIMEFYRENIQNKRSKSFSELGYQYVIQTKGTFSVEQDIVYIQLQNIRQTFKERGWTFEFLILNDPNLEKLNLYSDIHSSKSLKSLFHYYIIKLPPDSIYRLADLYQITCYNFKTKYICQFKYDQHMFFEFPKDLQVQMLILNILNDEFDVDKFLLEKLIISHFPLEDQAKCDRISQFWEEQQNNCIVDSIRYETQQIALRPLHAIASYFGPVVAWYIALNVQIIGWLIIPSIFGAALGIYIIITKDVNSSIIPFYALLMTLWSTLFMEKWKNRESELKFCWDMHKFKQTQPQRVMYTGQYIINEATNKIQIYDYFTTFKRRLIAEGPVILIGIAIVVLSFIAFNKWLAQQKKTDLIMPIVINSLNGVSMTVLCELYKWICKKLVTWENHMFESEQEYSYILKVFLFEFLISYVSVVYVAIFENDSTQLSISVASIIITRGVISNLKSNLLPYILYQWEKRNLIHKLTKFKEIYKSRAHNNKSIPKISNQNFINEKLTHEQQLKFLEELEISRMKQPQKILYDEYTNIAIQFGYTTMFAPCFPAAPIFFMINCYINLRLSIYNYQHILKRETAQAADSIGIWLSIFEIMNYAATFMNCIIIGTVNKEQLKGIIGDSDSLTISFVLAAIEHILLLIKYILDVSIPDCPYWVEKELRRYAYLEDKQPKNDHENHHDN